MAGGGIDGLALGSLAAGGLFLYAAIKGKTVLGSVQALIKGQSPSKAPAANAITGTGSGSGSGSGSPAASGGSAQAQLQSAAAQHGWGSGTEWQSLQSVEMAEAGFNPNARNPSSGAYGLAQALGHGNANTAAADGTNEYGGYGLSDAQAKQANGGDAGWQAMWMCNYIAQTYGDPDAAWAHEQANHWY